MPALLSLFLLWAAVVLTFILGDALTRIFPGVGLARQRHARVFFALLWGSIAVGTLTALVSTRGRTALAFAILPLLGLLVLREERALPVTKPARLPWTAVLEYAGLSGFFFLSQLLPLSTTPRSPLGLRVPHPDAVFFGFLGDSLLSTGQESIFPYASRYSDHLAGTTPYHYFEIWLAAAWARLFGRPAVEAYLLIVIPLLATLAVLGFWAIATRFGRAGPVQRLAFMLAPFLASWEPPAPHLNFFAGIQMLLDGPLPLVGKSLVIYVLLIGAVLLALDGCYGRALTLLVLLVPLSVLAAPAAAAAVVGGAWLLAARGRRRQAVVAAGTLVLVGAGMAGFYLATGNDHLGFASVTQIAAVNIDLSLWRTKLNVLGKTSLQLLFLYAPHALLSSLLIWRSAEARVVIPVAASALVFGAGAVLGYALLSAQLLAVEFAGVPVPPVVWVTLSTAFLSWHAGREAAARWPLVAVIAIATVGIPRAFLGERSSAPGAAFYTDRYGAGYLRALRGVASRCQRGGYLVGPSDAGDPWDQRKPLPTLAVAYPLGSQLSLIRGCASPTFLGSFDIRHSNAALLATTPFALLAQGSGEATADDLLRRFVRERRLQFVVASASASIPPSVEERVEREIVDPGTGERFLVLREEP